MAEAVPAFHDLNDAAFDQFIRGELINPVSFEFHRTLGDIAAFSAQQVGNRFERRGFTRSVRPEQGHDVALGYVERDSFQHQDHMVVNDLDVVDR